jgi:NAD(P)-dependent dehydrogenase (short-subunit alcohol dehydrogenase family)
MAQLQGKVIAITGAASGIGEATARLAAQRGASLSLADVNEVALNKLVEELKNSGIDVVGYHVDISDHTSVDKWITQTVEKFGRLDGAANVAGVGSLPGGKIIHSITETSNEHWDYMLRINLTGLFYCLRAELRHLNDNGAIINVTSLSGLAGYDGHGAYVSSKHGVQGLTKVAAKEGAARGIRVNALAPLVLPSKFYSTTITDLRQRTHRHTLAQKPIHRR